MPPDEGDRQTICVLMGGTSSEREVSLHTGQNVYEALLEQKEEFEPVKGELNREQDLLELVLDADLVFNCLHGGIGEDGTVQLLLDLLGVPYTGTGPLGSSVAMNKLYSKNAFQRASIATPPYVERGEATLSGFSANISAELSFPVVVKPVKQGSSRGVRIADDEKDLLEEVKRLGDEYGELFVEEYIDGVEVTAGVLEEDGGARALPLVELSVKNERFYNYHAKYTPGETEFIVPARISPGLTESVKAQALRAHSEFGCEGYSRVDFLIDHREKIFGLEVNTLPGMTETSDLPLAAEEAGISFTDLVKKMARSALQ